MWYVAWVLGVAAAAAIVVTAGLWFELNQERLDQPDEPQPKNAKN